MNIPNIRASLVLLALLAVTILLLTKRDTRPALAAAETDIAAALPSPTQLPGFKDYELKPEPKGKYVWAKRKTDGMQLRITVVALPTETEAQKVCDNLTYPPGGRMPRTSPSGRSIGQKVWMSQYPKGQSPTDAFTLVVLDGRTVTIVNLMLQIGKDSRGYAVSRKFASADLAFAETLAIGRVTKLAKMGVTSGGPAVRATSTKK